MQLVVELAGEDQLERDPARERHRQDEPSQQRGEHDEAAGESERERPEARRTPGLRDRRELGEGDEERGREHHDGDGEEAAEHVGGPAASQRQGCERDEDKRGDGDRPGPPEHLGREPVARVREDVELAVVLLEGSLHLVHSGSVGGRVAHHRQQPDEEPGRGHDERRQCGQDPLRLVGSDERTHEQEARERHPHEDRVGRVDDGEHEAGRRRRGEHTSPGPRDVCQRERDRGGDEQLPRGRCRQGQRGVGAAVARARAR